MEEMSPAVAVPFRVGNSVCDNQTIATHIDITRLKLMADKGGLLSDSVTKASTETVAAGVEDLANEVRILAAAVPKENKGGGALMLDMVSQNECNWVAVDDVIVAPESEEDDSLSFEGDQILDCSCSLSVASENSSLCGEEILVLEASSDVGTHSSIETGRSLCGVNVVAKAGNLVEPNDETEIVSDPVAVAVSLEEEIGDGSDPKPSAVLQLPLERVVSGISGRSVFEVDYLPLWGFTSMCGRRPEMEDAVAAVPRFLKIPVQMLISDRVLDGMTNFLPHQTVHFFGVYDGHGGSQVP
jgi:protein phosphatase 2C